ncbi:MAG: hypothetical protein AAB706_04255 [Patescibacteria group bacterium]
MSPETPEDILLRYQILESRLAIERIEEEETALERSTVAEIERQKYIFEEDQRIKFEKGRERRTEDERKKIRQSKKDRELITKLDRGIKKFRERRERKERKELEKINKRLARARLREEKKTVKAEIKLFHDWERELKQKQKEIEQEEEDNKSAFIEWLKTPIQELANLPEALKADYKDLFEREKPRRTVIKPPGWEDIIKLRPDVPVSPAEKRAWSEWRKKAKRAGHDKLGYDLLKIAFATKDAGSPPISSEQILTMGRRYARASQLMQSPTPKTVSNIGSVLTWFDDVNDALVSLAYLQRVGYALMRGTSPKLATRMLPGIKYVLIAKDLFDIAKGFRALNLLHSDGKRKYWQILEAIAPTTKKKITGMRKLKNLLPTFSEAIQIAQTTEVLTGYGLSLGPAVGFGLDGYFGAARQSELAGMSKYTEPVHVYEGMKNIKGLTDKSPNLTPATLDSMRILNALPNIFPFILDLSFDDVLLLLTAANHAAVYLAESGDLQDIDVWAADNIDTPEPPPTISEDVRFDLEELGVPDPGPTGLHPVLGGVSEVTPRMKVSLSASAINDTFRPLFVKNRDDPRVGYAATIIAELADNLIKAYEGKDVKIETKLGPAAAGFFQMREFGLDKKLGTPEDLEMSLAANITDRLIRSQQARLPYSEADALVDIYRRLI